MEKKQTNGLSAIWRVFYPILTYYGIYYLVLILAGILGLTFSMVSLEQSGASIDYYVLLEATARWVGRYSLEIALATALLVMIPTWFYWYADEKKRILTGRINPAADPLFYGAVFLLGAASCLAVNSLMNMSGLMETYEENAQDVGKVLYQGRMLLELAGIGVICPAAEELLFRGVVQNRLKSWMRPEMAIVAASVLFGFYHGNTLQFWYALVMGQVFGYTYEKSGHLTAPMLAHIGANLISVIASETGVLDPLLNQETSLILFTAGSCAAMVMLLYVVHTRVSPSRAQKEEESGREEF